MSARKLAATDPKRSERAALRCTALAEHADGRLARRIARELEAAQAAVKILKDAKPFWA